MFRQRERERCEPPVLFSYEMVSQPRPPSVPRGIFNETFGVDHLLCAAQPPPLLLFETLLHERDTSSARYYLRKPKTGLTITAAKLLHVLDAILTDPVIL